MKLLSTIFILSFVSLTSFAATASIPKNKIETCMNCIVYHAHLHPKKEWVEIKKTFCPHICVDKPVKAPECEGMKASKCHDI